MKRPYTPDISSDGSLKPEDYEQESKRVKTDQTECKSEKDHVDKVIENKKESIEIVENKDSSHDKETEINQRKHEMKDDWTKCPGQHAQKNESGKENENNIKKQFDTFLECKSERDDLTHITSETSGKCSEECNKVGFDAPPRNKLSLQRKPAYDSVEKAKKQSDEVIRDANTIKEEVEFYVGAGKNHKELMPIDVIEIDEEPHHIIDKLNVNSVDSERLNTCPYNAQDICHEVWIIYVCYHLVKFRMLLLLWY